jgi:four helix bundle protein
MQRAAVSMMSNIAEGHERGSAADYHHFLVIAKASCAELRSQLYVALDAEYITPAQFETLMIRASEVARIIGGLRASIAGRK